jgi:hypothetical protein
LTSLKDINEFYEGENKELNLTFIVELSWLKNVRSNFKSLEKMNNDIIALENRKTMPRT